MFPVRAFLFQSILLGVNAFTGSFFRSISRPRQTTPLFSSNDNGNVDSIRAMLEASWDSDTMGQVPSDARIAANEAFSSILSAMDKGVSVFFIDLLLPSYDVTQGSNLYDEVLAVEYCIALADCLSERSSILVRDDKIVTTVNRILELRQRDDPQNQATPPNSDKLADDDDEDMDEYEDDNGQSTSSIADFSATPQSDVDSFRQQLLSSWETSADIPSASAEIEKDTPADKMTPTPPRHKESTRRRSEKRYRLCSLFGNAKISSDGPDMMEKVVEALRVNALPTDDEKTLIILSAITREEMVAVRSLVAKYSGSKKIILVNCKLNPIPKELYGAETVYSLLPLIARQTGTGTDSQAPPSDSKSRPKIVVLRRYPGDWQVFVDVGKGFKLAKSAPSDLSNRRGPPIKWVQQSVQEFMRGLS